MGLDVNNTENKNKLSTFILAFFLGMGRITKSSIGTTCSQIWNNKSKLSKLCASNYGQPNIS